MLERKVQGGEQGINNVISGDVTSRLGFTETAVCQKVQASWETESIEDPSKLAFVAKKWVNSRLSEGTAKMRD